MLKRLKDKLIKEYESCSEQTAYETMHWIVTLSWGFGFGLATFIIDGGLRWTDHLNGIPLNTEKIVFLILVPIFLAVLFLGQRILCEVFWEGFIKKHVFTPTENDNRQGIGQND